MDARRLSRATLAAAAALTVAACAQQPRLANVSNSAAIAHGAADRECMARAMYFESHRGADEGMLAVGTVVANRLASGRYGASVCEVVAQKRQFAPGVMSRTMEGEAAERARRASDTVLSGKRHPGVRGAMFFHTAGLKFRYPNMHYVLVAGGNAFYEKREVATATDAAENARSRALAMAYARVDPTGQAKPIVLASLSPSEKAAATAPAPSIASQAAAPVAVAYAAADERPAAAVAVVARAEKPIAPQSAAPTPERAVSVAARTDEKAKRVIDPAKAEPALASSIPATASEPAPSENAPPPGYVANAFAAFN